MRIRRRVLVGPALLAATVLLAGCGGDDADEPSPSPSAGAPGTTTPPGGTAGPGSGPDGTGSPGRDDDAPPFPADASPDQQSTSAGALVTVTDVRAARHEGFDRVVFEVDGEGLPGWDVRYVDDPRSQGSGAPVEVDGEAVLQVTVTGVGYPFDTGVEEFPRSGPVPGAGTVVVTEVVFDATFEGTSEAFIGTTAQAPFRAYLIEGPARVVVEVVHPA